MYTTQVISAFHVANKGKQNGFPFPFEEQILSAEYLTCVVKEEKNMNDTTQWFSGKPSN